MKNKIFKLIIQINNLNIIKLNYVKKLKKT